MARVDGLSTAAVPVEILALDADGEPIDADGTFVLTNLYATITRASDGYTYDWSDDTFKASPTTASTALEAYNIAEYPGLFHLDGGWTPPDDDTYTITVDQVGAPSNVANVPLEHALVVGEYVGAATLGTNLVDELVEVADDLREELHADMGVRQYRAYGIRGAWSGTFHGEGARHIAQVYEFLPSPRVVLADRHNLSEGGLIATGTCKLEELSLTYTQAQITGAPVAQNGDWHIVLVDGLGQGASRRIFLPQDDPTTDRESNIGWEVVLRLDEPHNVVA